MAHTQVNCAKFVIRRKCSNFSFFFIFREEPMYQKSMQNMNAKNSTDGYLFLKTNVLGSNIFRGTVCPQISSKGPSSINFLMANKFISGIDISIWSRANLLWRGWARIGNTFLIAIQYTAYHIHIYKFIRFQTRDRHETRISKF